VVTGVLTVFFDVAYQSYLPSLVERENLVEGNTKLEVSRSVAQVAGPLIAGFLIQLVGAARVIAIDAASYLLSVILLVVIRTPEPARAPRTGGFLGELVEGLRFLFGNRTLANIAGCSATWNLGANMFFAVFLIFAYNRLRLSPGSVGLIFGAASVGGVLGAMVTGRVTGRLGPGPTLAATGLIAGTVQLAMPLALFVTPLPLLMGLSFIQGMQLPIYNITQVSLRQAIVSNELQGRVNATMRTIVWGTIPAGSLLGGVLGTAVGVVPTMLAGGALSALATIWVLAGPLIRLREASTQEE
jgi:predicted MFS family arabinose efflux permease